MRILHYVHWNIVIAVATTEADETISSSDFLKIMGISPHPPKRSQLGSFWSVLITSPRLILLSGCGDDCLRYLYFVRNFNGQSYSWTILLSEGCTDACASNAGLSDTATSFFLVQLELLN